MSIATGVQGQIWLNSFKQLTEKYIQNKNTDKFTKKYLEQLNNILTDTEKTTEQKIELLEKNTVLQLKNLQITDPKKFEEIEQILEQKVEKMQNEIFKQTNKTFLLEHKISKKDLKKDEKNKLQKFENEVAILLHNPKAGEGTKKFYAILAAKEDYKFTDLLTYNLLKNTLNVTKQEYAAINTFIKITEKEKNAEQYIIKNKENIDMNVINKVVKEYSKKDKTIDNYYKNILNKLYNVNTNNINFNPAQNKNDIEF